MLSFAKSSLAPVFGQRVPLRGSARMLFSSYARTRYQPQESDTRVTSVVGDAFDVDLSSTGVKTTVPAVTVDDVCAGVPVALVKIDVGGHEAAVVRGAADTIAGHAPAIIFEYAPELLDDVVVQAPFGWLVERGYEIFRIRAARHGITSRVRLALDRIKEQFPAGGNFLALSNATAASISSLPR
jgi:hypothetical protein